MGKVHLSPARANIFFGEKPETGKLKAEGEKTQVSSFNLQVSPLLIHRGICPISGRGISFRYRLVGPDYVPEHRAPKKPDSFPAIVKAIAEARDRAAERPRCRRFGV